MRRLTIDMSLIKILRAGPEVSLKGSPTVSPMTQALPCSVFLIFSFSHNFLELSQAPPALDIMMASMAPEVIAPARSPMRHCGPTQNPMKSGAITAYVPGAIISFTDDAVEIATHLSELGNTSSPSLISTAGNLLQDRTKTWNLAKLAPDFVDNFSCCFTNRNHRQGSEEVWKHGPKKSAGHHSCVRDVEHQYGSRSYHFLSECGHQTER